MIPDANNANSSLECLATEIPVPGSTLKIPNWYLPSESSNYLQRRETIYLDLQKIVCADLNAHDPAWDKEVRGDVRGEWLAETLLDANGTLLNDGRPTRQEPATSNFSTPDVTIVQKSGLQQISSLRTCDRLKKRQTTRVGWKSEKIQKFSEEMDKQLRSRRWSSRQDVANLYSLISTTINVAKTCVCLRAVGMNGDRWKTKEIRARNAARHERVSTLTAIKL